MAISLEEKVNFLKSRAMFRGLDGEEIAEIASLMDEFHQEGDRLVYAEGDKGSVFYIIYDGSVRVWRQEGEQEREIMILESGDKFGEGALIDNTTRSVTVNTLEDTDFLVMHKENFEWMIDQYPEIEQHLIDLLETREQIRDMYFPWMHSGEVIYIFTRRHPAVLWINLLKPFAVLLVSGILFYISTLTRLNTLPTILGFTLLIFFVIWTVWQILDWRNDYFILTNQRVVWIEQVIFQAAARQEAPLSAVQSVDVQTSQMGRLLGYGNVLVRTFTGTGSLKLTNVNDPKKMKSMIEELLMRVRKKTEVVAKKQLRQSIRQSLGIEAQSVEDTVFYVEKPVPETSKLALLRTREVSADGRTITYHRHWWVLLTKTWVPLICLVGMFAGLVYAWINNYVLLSFTIPTLSFYVFWFIGFFIFLGMIAYNYVDWKNDIYKINEDDMIIDSEKRPFGEEISRSAPIKNILSLTHERHGILRLLLNFGNVQVVVADATLPFYDVHNPAQVQQDIYYRQEQIKLQSEADDYEADREHISKWLRAYHDVLEEEASQKRRYMADDLDDEDY
jgi:membrane protein YdbS with pleckstrin-like domain